MTNKEKILKTKNIQGKTKEKTIKELVESPGKCKGECLRSVYLHIKKTKGEEGLAKIEKEMKDLGYPVDFKKVKAFDWYPIGLRALTLVALRRAFLWENKDVEKYGEALLDYSFVFKTILKFVSSFKDFFKRSDFYWKKHFTVGRMETYLFDKKRKRATVRIHDFKIHPDFCFLLLGYFKKLGKLSGKKNVKIEETKCIFKGDPYHEYVVSWE